jgi:carbamoyl-phosphate synthase small subunit
LGEPTVIPCLLALADGMLWPGRAFGAIGERTGEICFNTSLTGYQEILTDPSYHGQIVVMSQPHIGNTGVNDEDDESPRAWLSGFVVRAASPITSNWRATKSLDDYLCERGVVAISEVDTRALVRHIRTVGAQNAALASVDPQPDRLIALARSAPDMNGLDLAKAVTCAATYTWPFTHHSLLVNYHVVAYDYGIKHNILRLLANHGCRVTIVPAQTPASEVLVLNPDGVFLSNGPGDPAAVTYAIVNIQQLLGRVPIFGICLGHQLLGLALGGNQPVKNLDTNRVEISSHNHGFAVDANSLPQGVEVTHVNLNDNCAEGLRAASLRAFSVQYHPEAAPGPHDARYLFEEFVKLMADGG